MLRVPAQARVLMATTVGLGLGAVAVGAVAGGLSSLATLALLTAAVVLTELFQVEHDENSLDPADAHASSFSTGVHFAAVLIAGAPAAAIVAGLGVVIVDRIRGRAWTKVAFNASAFALAAGAGGLAFTAAGGEVGRLHLPGDFVPIAAMAVTYTAVNTGLVASIIALIAGRPPWTGMAGSFSSELPAAAAQAGLGVLLALCAEEQPWAAAALAPLLIAVYNARARLVLLRRETARALETFANVVDERDPYTYRHSARVAESVRELAEALELPRSVVVRLHWAGRLHDLGKIAVDAAVLRKPAALSAEEWSTLRRHPRLSARLLLRFRFASEEARAVEYHHERFDGRGYYEVDRERIPLAAHFLVVADTYDAMRSDRPYRTGLPAEEALAEIEAGAGTQFHPTVAKAFVALQRGQDPLTVLSDDERVELRRVSFRRERPRSVLRSLETRPELSTLCALSAALFAYGLGSPILAAVGAGVAVVGVAWTRIEAVRASRLARALDRGLREGEGADTVFHDLANLVGYASSLRWAGLVSWRESELDGRVHVEWGDPASAPPETALTSWLVRESESPGALVVTVDEQLGNAGTCAALPLRRDGGIAGYVVFVFARELPRHVEVGLREAAPSIAEALVDTGQGRASRGRRLAAVS